jgi:zinc transporter ZupT
MRRFVAFLAGLIVLAGVNLVLPAILPSIDYQSGNHEIATTIALGGAFVTWAIVYALYPRLRRGSGKP